MRIDHPTDLCMLFALSVAVVCVWASCARAEEPVMMQTIDAPSYIEWVLKVNPTCGENDKIWTTEYDTVAVDCKTSAPFRYRTWICASTGEKGADIEHLPSWFCDN